MSANATIKTVSDFKTAALKALDAELENQLGLTIEDYPAFLEAAREAVEETVVAGEPVAYILDDLSEDMDIINIADSLELWEYIKLNPEFDQYIDFCDDTARLADNLYHAFYTTVTRAPERAIRTYLVDNFGIDPYADTDWELIEDN